VKRQIKYFSFWDVPRTFVFERDERLYMLTSEFDEEIDDYPDKYDVFVLLGIEHLSAVSDWKSVESLTKTFLGKVPVSSVLFDASRRRHVDDSFLSAIIAVYDE
jgi:hypothetical protein